MKNPQKDEERKARRGGRDERSLRQVLGRAFLVLYVSVFLAGGGAVLAEFVVTHRVDQLAGRLQPLAEANASMLQDLTNAESGVRGYELTDRRTFLQPYEEGVVAYPSALRSARELARGNTGTEQLIGAEAARVQLWLTSFARPAVSSPPGSSTVRSLARGKALFDAVRRANARVAERVQREIGGVKGTIHLEERRVTIIVAVLLVATLVSGSVMALRVVRGVVLPLERVAAALRAMREGQSGVRVEVEGTTETGDLARAVNALAEESEQRARTVRQRARLRELHVEIMRNFNEHLDLERLVYQAVTVLGTTLEADRALLRLVEGGARPRGDGPSPGPSTAVFGRIVAEWSVPGTVPASQFGEAPATLVETLASCIADGRCHDGGCLAADLAARDPAVAEYLSALAVRSFLLCPLVVDGRTVGLISLVSSRAEGAWDEETRSLVEASAADLARAVGHAYLYEEQRQLVAELEEADRAKTHWIGNVSHELRTPLTTVRGYLEMLQDGDAGTLPKKALEMLGAMERNAVRLQGLIENLLTLSKVGAGTFQVAKVPVAVGDLARSVAADMAPLAAGHDVALDLCDEAGGTRVLGDPDALSRVLVNLVSNAIKFSSPGGRVKLALRAERNELSLTVSDTGVGIPADDLPHVGERFFRASNAESAVVPGTGLGLSIVRAVVEALDGDFALSSAEGVGTTAVVTLPIYIGAPADLSWGDKAPSASLPGPPLGQA